MKRSKALSILVTALTVLLCAALCVGVLTLYLGGLTRRSALQSATEPLFTREAAGRWLLGLSPLFALWLAAVIIARLLGAEGSGRPAGARQIVKPRGPLRGQPETKKRRLIRAALYALAAALIALGVMNGGLRDVLVKAIHICTECIGLG